MKKTKGEGNTADSGFTLLEVLIAAFILGVAVLGLVIGLNRGLALVGDMREISTADRLAQETMEEMRGGIRAVGTDSFESGRYTVTIADLAVAEALTRVTVTVQFNSQLQGSVERSLVTYFTEGGVSK